MSLSTASFPSTASIPTIAADELGLEPLKPARHPCSLGAGRRLSPRFLRRSGRALSEVWEAREAAPRHVIECVELRFAGAVAGADRLVIHAEEDGSLVEKGVTESVVVAATITWTARALLNVREGESARLVLDAMGGDRFLGRAVVDVRDVMESGMRAQVALEGGSGSVSVVAERVCGAGVATGVARRGRPGVIVLRVNCAALRRKGLGKRGVVLFYEVQRRRVEGGGGVSWTPVYRSEEGGRRVNDAGYIEFRNAHVDEGALHNGDPERELRLVVLKRGFRGDDEVVCYAGFTAEKLVIERRGAPLIGTYVEFEGVGAMQTMGVRKGMTDDVVVVDISVDIFAARGFNSALNDGVLRHSFLKAHAAKLAMKRLGSPLAIRSHCIY